MTDRATAYARAVKAGKIVAGPHVRNACRRHLADLKTQKAAGLRWRPEEADRVFSFFEEALTLESGAPFILQPWQAFIVGSLFGWHMADGGRRFQTAYIETGKGNGKSPLAAGIGLAGLVIDEEPAPEVYSAATTSDQAKIIFKDARGMAQRSPRLAGKLEIFEHSISDRAGGVFRPVSSEHRGLDGKRVHIALIDELHEHPSDLVLDKMRMGTKGRRNPLVLSITNAGHDRGSVCWREHEYAVKIASGAAQNPRAFSYVCAMDDGDDYREPANWYKANPNLGVTIQPDYIAGLIREAEGMPGKLNLILRLVFCVWTESHTVWISDAVWMKNAGALTPQELEKRIAGRAAWIGLDLAATSDYCAAVAVLPRDVETGDILARIRKSDDHFPTRVDHAEGYDILARFWICEENFISRVKAGREPVAAWRAADFLSVTPGGATDYDQIERDLLAWVAAFDVREIVYDRYWSSQLVAHLADKLGEQRLVQFGQGTASLNAPVGEIERLAAREALNHAGNPVLRWQIGNVAIKGDSGGLRKIDKARSAEKVDGAVALAMAIGRAMVRTTTAAPAPSVYERRGLLIL